MSDRIVITGLGAISPLGLSVAESWQNAINGVSGVGPKLALTILSGMDAERFARAVQAGDLSALVALPGVGKKTAERIALELKDKALKIIGDRPSPLPPLGSGEDKVVIEDAVSALLNLGYPAKSAKMAVDKASAANMSPVTYPAGTKNRR